LSSAAAKTALVRRMGFSKPTVTTMKGKPSERRTIFRGTPSFVDTIKPKSRAKVPEPMTVNASQKLDPSRRIDMNSDTNVRCMAV